MTKVLSTPYIRMGMHDVDISHLLCPHIASKPLVMDSHGCIVIRCKDCSDNWGLTLDVLSSGKPPETKPCSTSESTPEPKEPL